MWKKLHYMDYVLFIPYLILSGIGVVMVYSSSSYVAAQNGSTPTGYLVKQLIWVVLGLVITLVCMNLKIDIFKQTRLLGMLGFAMLFVLVLLRLIGQSINGAAGWIILGPVSIQPAEFCKFYLIIYLASIISQREAHFGVARMRELGAQFVMLFAMILLIFVQPDLGGATINLAIAAVILFASGISYFVGVGVFAGAVAAFEWILVPLVSRLPQSAFANSYQLRRFLGFLNPFKTASGAGTQLVNSYYAISNGGLTGVGIGNSLQKRGYLPEPNTDFIMSITSEELGLIGILLIMGLLLVIVMRTIYIGVRATNTFNALVCYGVAAYMTIQAFINVGGIVGLIPITGVTFPFMSYGGSSMMVLTLSLGLVLNISALEKMARLDTVRQAG
ncbi:FtsW/RodA/SpoVE family cell cycle protein [Lactiplantibacillus plantarum]|uniref:FtsW/RodA/SpoVE family cell cycle protein n=1 Tax=Lactiplantibacillus plantarum TaxID=1590 RepID=UPI0006C19336|nr:FtsW/RodA/SpoVE family cell cycle protein [Lactiplantibacillus plantarum]AYC71486.1 FtsW/RodA/SpoVE family cell cycle protein [Lactiplantibacillus plantarum]KON40743.1 cell division protein FtsW [Lactiplantibacillus plantarum]RDG02717.1 FtsW/RodA/SpoVE family cell cycle protein [Lactiplantibacillus plantarum]